jgi:hypothetical protein
MNIREGMGIKTIEGALGIITKAEMKSHNGEVWYDLCIKPVNNNGYVSEYHGLEKNMYKYFVFVGSENLQTVSMSDFKALREQVIRLTEEVKAIKETLNKAVLHTL